MHGLKRWLDHSLFAQALLIFPLGVAVTALFRQDAHPVRWLVQGAIYTGAALACLTFQRRRVGRAVGSDPDTVTRLDRKIRRREVPGEPGERAAMRRLVAEHERRLERSGRWLPYWLGGMALIAVVMLVLGAVTGSLVVPVLFAAGVGAFCCWIVWVRRRSEERCRFMRSALREQESEPAA
ncbi:hypothetical protein [Streptomyces sp. CC224B]|uniref:hypothetical protein n=1 Tax=Streptomyces sp. CC224B TaxID=3044571 RepID=UPI0024A90BA6|nr:hypothetical protein [Streptomyces sp. CC224B]